MRDGFLRMARELSAGTPTFPVCAQSRVAARDDSMLYFEEGCPTVEPLTKLRYWSAGAFLNAHFASTNNDPNKKGRAVWTLQTLDGINRV